VQRRHLSCRTVVVDDRADAGVPVGNAPEELAAFVKADVPRWAKLVRYSGARPD
jgi:hypothetical protein